MTPNLKAAAASENAAFVAVIEAFADDPQVTPPGAGQRFGDRRALKVKGKIFAMMSSKGEYVVKLSRDRVSELIKAGRGAAFDPGHGRVMKQWIVITAGHEFWVPLAREARQLVD